MLKLYCVTEIIPRLGDPVIKGHQTGEMILYEAKDFSPSNVTRLQTAIKLLFPIVANVYRINAVRESAQEYRETMAHVQSPVNRIHVGINGNEAYSDRDILLKKCKSGENKKQILREQDNEISLTPIVNMTEKCLIDIHDGLMDYQIDEQVVTEGKEIKNFIESKELLYKPWIIMDEMTKEPTLCHINDMRAYGYILGRIANREKCKR